MGRWTPPNMSPPLHLLHLPWQPGVDERIRGCTDSYNSRSSLSCVYIFPLGLWEVHSGAGVGLAHLSRGKMCFNTLKWRTDIWKIILNVRCEDTVTFFMCALYFRSFRVMRCWLCLCCCGNDMFPLSSQQPKKRRRSRRLRCKGCWDTWSLLVDALQPSFSSWLFLH